MSLADKLKEIDRLKLELDKLLPMSDENEHTFWKKIRLDWNFNSNNIEGNTLTYGETKLLLIFDKTTGNHELREYEEMKAHDVAIHLIKDWAKDKNRDLLEKDIRELNKIILVKPYWKEAQTSEGYATKREIKVGEYKEFPNSVRLKNGEIFEYVSPSETPIKMGELVKWYRKNELHPLVLASQLHYDFIRIHPFDDGNGRVARLLVNYVLMKNDFPPIIIKTKDKGNYLTALNKADVGDVDAFHEYIAEQLISSLEMNKRAAKGENIDEDDDYLKEIELLSRKFQSKKSLGSPELIFEIFELIQSDIYSGIKKTLNNFNKLFRQSQVTQFFNNKLGKPTFRNFYSEVEKTKSQEIFGYNIQKIKVDSIKWCYELIGLIGSKKEVTYEVDFEIKFAQDDYTVELYIDLKQIFSFSKQYNDLMFTQQAHDINKILQKELLNQIQKDSI